MFLMHALEEDFASTSCLDSDNNVCAGRYVLETDVNKRKAFRNPAVLSMAISLSIDDLPIRMCDTWTPLVINTHRGAHFLSVGRLPVFWPLPLSSAML
jgi:hypothetical protein